MGETRADRRPSVPTASGWSALGTVTAYAAAVAAFGYALVSGQNMWTAGVLVWDGASSGSGSPHVRLAMTPS